MDVQTERQHLLDEIERRVDAEYQAGVSMAVPTGLKVYGVRVPQLRDLAGAWARTHKEVAREDLIALVDALWNGKSREERLLVIYLPAPQAGGPARSLQTLDPGSDVATLRALAPGPGQLGDHRWAGAVGAGPLAAG